MEYDIKFDYSTKVSRLGARKGKFEWLWWTLAVAYIVGLVWLWANAITL